MLKTARIQTVEKSGHPRGRSKRRTPVEKRGMGTESTSPARGSRTTLLLGLAGALLLWAAFPPVNWPWLAWIAPMAWLWLVRWPQLPGWRPYIALWLAGFVHWLLMLQGIRLAHPARIRGLDRAGGLSGRLLARLYRLDASRRSSAEYIGGDCGARGLGGAGTDPRLSHHRFFDGTARAYPGRIPATPSDFRPGWRISIELCHHAGRVVSDEDRVGSLDSSANRPRTSVCWWPAIVGLAAIFATVGYGNWRLGQSPPGARGPTAHVALIQGSLDTVFEISRSGHKRRSTITAS